MKAAEISAYCRERFTKNGIGPAVFVVMPPKDDSDVCEWAVSPAQKDKEQTDAIIQCLREMADQLESGETQFVGVYDAT